MPIYFGDELKNQNPKKSLIDAIGSSSEYGEIKGLHFVDSWNEANVATNLDDSRKVSGAVLVDKSTGNVRIYIGDVDGGGSSGSYEGWDNHDGEFTSSNTYGWKIINALSGDDILVSMPATVTVGGVATRPTFGKFVTGQTITINENKTAFDIIKEAVQSAATLPNPTSFSGATAIDFKIAAQTTSVSRTISCSITNPNKALGTTIASIVLKRKLGSGSYGSAIQTLSSGSPGSTSANGTNFTLLNNGSGTSSSGTFTFDADAFTHTHADSSGVTDNYTYQVTVTDSEGATASGTTTMTVDDYSAPTIASISITRRNSSDGITTNESNSARERGNTRSALSFTITQNETNVALTGYRILRSVNDGSFSVIQTVTTSTFGAKSYNDDYDDAAATKIEYKVEMKDAQNTSFGATGMEKESGDVLFYFPVIIGGAPAAARTTLTTGHVTGAITQDNIMKVVNSGSLPNAIASFNVNNTGNASGGAYLLIAYPGTTEIASMVNSSNENLLGSITKMSGSGITVTPNTGFDADASGTYTVYVSNAGNSFSNQNGINIG